MRVDNIRPFYLQFSGFACNILTWFEIILPVSTKTLRPKLTQAEGLITGMAVKMFTIAGPVIVYGTVASVLYGVVLMLFR